MCIRLNIQGDGVFLLAGLPAAVSIENVCVGFPRALSSSLLSAHLLADQRHCANRRRRRQEIMVSEKFYLRLLTFVALLTVLALSGHFSSFFLVLSCTLHLTVFFLSKMSAKMCLHSSYVWSMNVGDSLDIDVEKVGKFSKCNAGKSLFIYLFWFVSLHV